MWRRLILGVGMLWSLVACTGEQSAAEISLTQLAPLPVKTSTTVLPLRMAVAAVVSPQGNLESYSLLLDYLSDKLERPVELIQRRTYAEVNNLIQNGEVDFAFVCTSAYIVGAETFGMKLLVAPQVNQSTHYHSLLIVSADSQAQNIADLEGRVFAFTDPMSNSGRNYPTYLVHRLGSTPDQFFERTIFTYSHDDAIRAVASGVAEGAAVDSLVYNYAIKRIPQLAAQTRIIHRSPPFGIPPVVTGPHIRPQLEVELRQILLEMHTTDDGRAALELIGIERFVLVDDQLYDSVRQLSIEVTSR